MAKGCVTIQPPLFCDNLHVLNIDNKSKPSKN